MAFQEGDIGSVLTVRLTKVADSVISETQSAFIPGRLILDGAVIVHEVVHHLKSCKRSGIILKLDFEKAYDKVDWSFMKDVLRRKNFGEKWISWMERVIEEGRVAINLNGEKAEYFRSYKGLRQGDPLSPMLFNLVGEGLAEILRTAREKGLVEDDTILFLKNSEDELSNFKLLLFCFEEMSGMRINYNKSEVYTLGVSVQEGQAIADKLNCKLGKFPMKYLGVPISDRRSTMEQMIGVVEKVEK
ncbi:hypothetical protein U9M48_004904 [Paspalum notatum var. saurae]|uniref:Reverse transcriptase domain-containing protein n=1 Tax=Paspalum notatum var. saurae TaxID=547442 RepID=A0AAQ3PVN7_PASNO